MNSTTKYYLIILVFGIITVGSSQSSETDSLKNSDDNIEFDKLDELPYLDDSVMFKDDRNKLNTCLTDYIHEFLLKKVRLKKIEYFSTGI